MKILKRLIIVIASLLALMAILFTIGYIATTGDYSVPETVADNPSLPHITLNGVTFHSETFGDITNPVVIVIHGGPGGDYRSLLPLKKLADQFYVVFYDQRGTGLSPRVNPDEITGQSSLDDLDSIINHFGEGKPVNIIGHSWGAMLASGYIGQHPEKVNHLVLAEPGFLTAEDGKKFMEKTSLHINWSLFTYFLKTKFESLHVNGPDPYASDDYFVHKWSLYQGAGHPQAGFRCKGAAPDLNGSWRLGSTAASALFKDAVDEKGNFKVSFIDGVENFDKKILFMTGACQTIIGEEWQKKNMTYFPETELVVIPEAGHEMFSENTEASLQAVRKYFSENLRNSHSL